METDRGAVLTLRAAARGVIDFSKARPYDVSWWRRTNLLLRAMSQADDLELAKAAFAFQCALVGSVSPASKLFDDVQEHAQEAFREVAHLTHPWNHKSAAEEKQEQIQRLIDDYKRLVGDPSDPAFREKLRRGLEADRKHRERKAEEKPEDRVRRLLQERNRKRRMRQGS